MLNVTTKHSVIPEVVQPLQNKCQKVIEDSAILEVELSEIEQYMLEL